MSSAPTEDQLKQLRAAHKAYEKRLADIKDRYEKNCNQAAKEYYDELKAIVNQTAAVEVPSSRNK
ncbi:hypothetical protein AAVH_02744 [Aphelenchoides avenae]|nr:hypothetical protein AAVH_02744 [Aphelenchus avenae]